MSRFEKMLGEWVVRKRWWIVIATLALVVTAGSGARFLTMNNDNRVFFSEKNPQLKALEALENTYTRTENVFFAIAPEDGNVFTVETLTAVEELTEASWQVPFSNRVDSITNFQHTRAEGDDLVVEDLVGNAAALSGADLARVKATALAEPVLAGSLVSPSGSVTGVNINVLLPGESTGEVSAVTAFARGLAEEFRGKHPEIDIHLTGGVLIDNAFGEVGADDMATLFPLMFLVLLIITGVALRSFSGTFATLAVIFFSVATGMGLAGWLGIGLSAASVGAPIIILTLAVADSVHILVTMFQEMRRGRPKGEAIAETVRVNVQPVLLTSATTVIGFLSMNFSDAPPFRDLGNIVAMGVGAAFAYSVLFLPSLMAILPVRVRDEKGAADRRNCDRLADFVINRRGLLFWGTLAAAVLVTAGSLRIELHDDFVKYFDDRYEIRRATDFVTDNLRGFNIIEYSLEAGGTGDISDPAYLARVEAFGNWYRRQPKVVHVDAVTDIFKRLNMNMHGDDPSWYRIPGQRDLAAQYLLLYEMSLPFGLDLNNQINVDKSATRMVVLLKDATTTDLREIDTQARAWLKANAPESMFTYGTGLSILWAHISERNIRGMLGASFGALGIISLILVFALGSLRLGLISLATNVMPAFMAFGVWGLLVGQVGLGLSVIVSMTIGIVVDDTVHFLSKYKRARREHGLDPAGAVRYSFNTVGTALWVTTAALVAGFMVLSFSGFRMNSDMGQMTAITITLALALDFFFLPALLMRTESKPFLSTKKKKENKNETFSRYPDIVPGVLSVSAARRCCRGESR